MIYDVIAYSKPADVPQNVGSVIKKVRVSSDEGEQLDIIPLVNNFFGDVNLSALNVGEPAITLIEGLKKVTTNEELNDILGTLRFYGVYFAIIALPSLSEGAEEDPETQAYGYLTLQKPFKSESYSVPLIYSGTVVAFKEVPTVGILLLEILKQMPLPNTFGKFTSVKGLLDYYSNSDLETSPFVRIPEILKALESLGYGFLGLIM